MLVKEIMTRAPACCSPETNLNDVARMMAAHDCGVVPICDGTKMVGIVTDRDLVCRGFAGDEDPRNVPAAAVMTSPVATINDSDQIQHAITIMSEHRVRRLPVMRDGQLVGIVSLADLAEHLPLAEIGSIVRRISVSTRRAYAMA